MKIPGLSEESNELIVRIFKEFNEVREVILYGSRALGTFRDGSDIDITLVGENLTTSLLLEIENEFDDLPLPYKSDISILSHISNPDLIDHIKRVGIIIYRR